MHPHRGSMGRGANAYTWAHICTSRYTQIKNSGVGEEEGGGTEATEHTTKSEQTALSYELS